MSSKTSMPCAKTLMSYNCIYFCFHFSRQLMHITESFFIQQNALHYNSLQLSTFNLMLPVQYPLKNESNYLIDRRLLILNFFVQIMVSHIPKLGNTHMNQTRVAIHALIRRVAYVHNNGLTNLYKFTSFLPKSPGLITFC